MGLLTQIGLGEIFSLASAMTWAVAVILFKRSGETLTPTALNLFKNLLAAMLLAITVPLVHGLQWPRFSAMEWLLLVISGLIGIGLADNFYFEALRNMGASRTGIASSLFSPSVIVLSFFLLGERLNVQQCLGFVLVVSAVVMVSYKPDRKDVTPDQLRRGVLFAISAVFLMALGIVMIKRILETGPFMWIVEIRMLSGILGILVVGMVRDRLGSLRQAFRGQHNWYLAGTASLLGSYLAIMLWLAGYKYTSASVASVLNETSVIFIVLLAWLALGERLEPRKVAGVLVSFAGVLLMVTG